MIKLESVSKKFHEKEVMKNISCEILEGDFISIVGANGAGKTTFFDIISGKVKSDSGKIFIDGKDITVLDEQHRAKYIARLFQNTYLGSIPSMTVRENLSVAMLKSKRSGLRKCINNFPSNVVDEILLPLGLQKYLDVSLGLLSGGQRQVIAFVMATLNPPKILLLDEPTAALDPNSATKLLCFVRDFVAKQKITTLLITHDPHIAIVLGNKLWVLEDGKISKKFEDEKYALSPESLIGHIDYKLLARN